MTHSPTTTPAEAALKREAAPASSKRHPLALALAALAVAALLVLSLSTGEYSILSQDDGWQIFLAVRVPRTIALVLSGAAMSMSGLVMQLVTQNRFAEPSTTGTTEWAGLGLLVIMIVWPGAPILLRMTCAIVFAFVGTMVFFALLRRVSLRSSLLVPIMGMMLGAVVSAISTFLALETNTLQSVSVWFQGSFTSVYEGQYEVLWIVTVVVAIVFIMADRLTAVSLGEDIAISLGVNYHRMVLIATGLVAVATGVVTVVVGSLPFLGLIVPNLVSMSMGDNLRTNLPHDHLPLRNARLGHPRHPRSLRLHHARAAPGQEGSRPVSVLTSPAHREASTPAPTPTSSARTKRPARHTGAFTSPAARRRWWILFGVVCTVAILACIGLLAWKNPAHFGTPVFWRLARRRAFAVLAIAIVAVCQGMATVAFQTVANNRIITPSILGFESLYRAIHTSTIFFLGVAGLNASATVGNFVGQLALMIALTLALYSWLLTSQRASMHAMLLIGVMLGAGLGSISTFMQRLLTPSEFDVLTARLFGSIANAQKEYFPIAVPLVAAAAIALVLLTRQLSVLSLGRETATNLGLNHRRTSVLVLVLVSILMATSTALVGPMTFLGFLVATLAYQFSDTHDHRYIFAMSVALGAAILASAYFVMNHVFNTQGVVSIIIEFVGGLAFIVTILRKGRL